MLRGDTILSLREKKKIYLIFLRGLARLITVFMKHTVGGCQRSPNVVEVFYNGRSLATRLSVSLQMG